MRHLMPRHRPRPFCRQAVAGRSESGFSLVEVLMGAIILAGALGMAAALNGVATRDLRSSTLLNDRNAAMDADIATIRSLAGRYTWCSGSGQTEWIDVPTCLGRTPSDESYFSPAVSQEEAIDSPDQGNQSMVNFTQACAAGTLSDDLVAKINQLPAITIPDTKTDPNNSQLYRKATKVATTDNADQHRIQVLYQTSTQDDVPALRSVLITPPVASFCP